MQSPPKLIVAHERPSSIGAERLVLHNAAHPAVISQNPVESAVYTAGFAFMAWAACISKSVAPKRSNAEGTTLKKARNMQICGNASAVLRTALVKADRPDCSVDWLCVRLDTIGTFRAGRLMNIPQSSAPP